MQRQQGLGCILLKPGAIEGQVANLLALGIKQEGAHRWRGHIWPGRGPDHGWSDGGYTRRGGARLGTGALHLSAIFVHTPAEVALSMALQGREVAQVIALGHVLVIPGGAAVVLQQVFPPALTDGRGPLGGLWWWSTVRRCGARWSLGTRNFMTIRVYAPAEASAAVTLQGQEVALIVALGDVEPGPRVGILGLGMALLFFTRCQA